jgi:NH3-dependent NAD+ synthetase
MDKRLKTLIKWLRKSTRRARGILVPVSGGSDSALIFWLFNQACPEKTIGVYSGSKSQLRCRAWFESVGEIRYVPAPRGKEDRESRRWATFSTIAIAEQRWLVGSKNRSEEVMGNFSLPSRIATFLPLAGVWKSDVMELCALAGVPTEITDSSRRADPDCGRPKEMSEIPLELIDVFLKVKEGGAKRKTLKALDTDQIKYLEGVYSANQFRRHLPVRGPEVG